MKMRRVVLRAGLALLSLLALPPASLAIRTPAPQTSAKVADDRFSDRVGTLELSQELDARGRLGGMTVDALGFLYVANFRDAV